MTKTCSDVTLEYVTCTSNPRVLHQRLLQSDCFQSESRAPLTVHINATSAARGFNATANGTESSQTSGTWLVWVHDDVYLPPGWEEHFKEKIKEAIQRWPKLGVVGVYGVASMESRAANVGHVLDRGNLLKESIPLPCLVDSLDELLLGVRLATGLRFDPEMEFDFYGTDLVLQAQTMGWDCAVVDAYCEHWSGTSSGESQPLKLAQRIKKSATIFEAKWASRMPITTSCFHIAKPGDVAAWIDKNAVNST
jgi:hypothetical protein